MKCLRLSYNVQTYERCRDGEDDQHLPELPHGHGGGGGGGREQLAEGGPVQPPLCAVETMTQLARSTLGRSGVEWSSLRPYCTQSHGNHGGQGQGVE